MLFCIIGVILLDDSFYFRGNGMRIITKLFVAILVCAAITIAQTKSTTTSQTNNAQTMMLPKAAAPQGPVTNVPKKQATSWTQIKDLFL